MSTGRRAYVTYFDQRYLAFALVMLRSLVRHDPEAEIYPLCLDEPAFRLVAGLGEKRIVPVSAQALYDFEPALAACADRRRLAFYSTHKPVLPLYVLSLRPDLSAIAHVDADTFFFSSPAPLFGEIGGASIAVSPHRFSKQLDSIARFANLEKFGVYNAGFIFWKNDALGLRCLNDYRADCLKWCGPTVEPDGRFMNQGYLTTWPQRYPEVRVIQHPGVNLSWWNMAGHRLTDGKVPLVDGAPLIFYHFSNLVLDGAGVWRTHREFGDNLQIGIERIYAPYLEDVERTDRWLRTRAPNLLPKEAAWQATDLAAVRAGPWPRSVRGWLARAKWHLGPQ
jgi:hypothetical protein